MKGEFYPHGKTTKCTVQIGTGTTAINIVECTIQNSSDIANIYTPVLYSSANISILNSDLSLYANSLIGQSVRITCGNIDWQGVIVSNIANANFNYDKEVLNFEAVDKITMLKNTAYTGEKIGTAKYFYNLIRQAVGATQLKLPIEYTNNNTEIYTQTTININSLFSEDDKVVFFADVLEELNRYFNITTTWLNGGVIQCVNWRLLKQGNTNYFIISNSNDTTASEATQTQTITTGYNATANTQVTLLEPKQSVKIIDKFSSVEVAPDTYSVINPNGFTSSVVNEDENIIGWGFMYQNYYSKGAKSICKLIDSTLIDTDVSTNINYPERLANNTDLVPSAYNMEKLRGAIILDVASGEVKGQNEVAPSGVISYEKYIMLWSHNTILNKNGGTIPLYTRIIECTFNSNNDVYIILNTSVIFQRYPDFVLRYLQTSQEVKTLIPLTDTTEYDLTGATAYINFNLKLYNIDGTVTTQTGKTINFEIATDEEGQATQFYNKSFSAMDFTNWNLKLEHTGAKFLIPAGTWTKIEIEVINIDARRWASSTTSTAINFNVALLKEFEINIERVNSVDNPSRNTDTEYFWNNDQIVINGDEESEDFNICSSDNKNIADNIVMIGQNELTAIKSVSFNDTLHVPEYYRCMSIAKQYEDSTFSLFIDTVNIENMIALKKYTKQSGNFSNLIQVGYILDLKDGILQQNLIQIKD